MILLQNALTEIFCENIMVKSTFFFIKKSGVLISYCIITLTLEHSSKANKIIIIMQMFLSSPCWGWKNTQVTRSSEQGLGKLLFPCFFPWLLWSKMKLYHFFPLFLWDDRNFFIVLWAATNCCTVPMSSTPFTGTRRTSNCCYSSARAQSDTFCNGLVKVGRWIKCDLN